MRLPGLLAVTLLVLLPSASAGSEQDPEVVDPADQEWTPTDLLAAWFDVEESGVRFSIKSTDGSAPRQYPDHIYWVSFKVAGRAVGATVGFGNDGVFRGHLGPLSGSAWERGGFERVANNGVVDLREDRGTPSIWSGVVPWGAVPGLEEGATLTDISAGTAFYDREQDRWRGGLDVAAARRPFVAEPEVLGGFFPILVPQWVIPTIVLACVAGGMGAGFAMSRGAPKTRAKVATSVPVQTTRAPPPPPGQRFQRAPPSAVPKR